MALSPPLPELTENSPPLTIDVTRADLRALRRARVGLAVEELGEGQARVAPKQGYVGSVSLSAGRSIVVRPKADVGCLPDLLALAYRTMAAPARVGAAEHGRTTPTEWLLLQVISEVEAVAARGLRRGYEERRELLPFVRGRVRPALDPSRLPLVDCEYTDFTLDTPENRLLRGTLEVLAPIVANFAVRRRYRNLLGFFGTVTPAHPTLHAFDRVRLSPLSAYYGPALGLCRLALEGAGLADTPDAVPAPAFFVPMWRVWEAAIQNILTDEGIAGLRFQPEYADKILNVVGNPSPKVLLIPDVVIGPRQAPTRVIDAKWAPAVTWRHGAWRLNNVHLYQLGTYCTALGCDGALVYPQMTVPVDTTYEFNGRTLRVLTVDLSTKTPYDLVIVARKVAGL